ncbi:hypothetical protein ACFP3Q_05400 [Nocardioides sp. GCM10027113]|uniref:hypothetical protein n=1 Tax=unclassified Nocardioides TaxID=2615069 RepID=UPI003613443D
MEIVERAPQHLRGASLSAPIGELPLVAPSLWRRVMEFAEAGQVHAELSAEPGGDVHRITVGVLVDEPGEDTVAVPGGRWLHHRHEGDVRGIGDTYARMFEHADEVGERTTNLKLDVGYLPDGSEQAHDLYLQLG